MPVEALKSVVKKIFCPLSGFYSSCPWRFAGEVYFPYTFIQQANQP